MLIEVGRRNRNFKALQDKHPGLFIKQIKTSDQLAISTLQREAVFYHQVCNQPRFAALKQMLPDFVDYDPSRYALVIKLIPQGESLAEYQQRTAALSAPAAAAMGRALGRCHAQLPHVMAEPATAQLLRGEIPWTMSLKETGYAILDSFGGVGALLASAIREHPTLEILLSQLRQNWQYDSLIHGDPKWENFIVCDGDDTGESNLKLIDWELVDVGDGAWDVAMVLKEYLVSWILSIPDPANPTPHVFAPANQLALADIQPCVRRFWQAYSAERGLSAAAADIYFKRAVRFTSGRLIVAILEYFFPLNQLNNHAYAMLKLSLDILQNPEKASLDLLGAQTI